MAGASTTTSSGMHLPRAALLVMQHDEKLRQLLQTRRANQQKHGRRTYNMQACRFQGSGSVLPATWQSFTVCLFDISYTCIGESSESFLLNLAMQDWPQQTPGVQHQSSHFHWHEAGALRATRSRPSGVQCTSPQPKMWRAISRQHDDRHMSYSWDPLRAASCYACYWSSMTQQDVSCAFLKWVLSAVHHLLYDPQWLRTARSSGVILRSISKF